MNIIILIFLIASTLINLIAFAIKIESNEYPCILFPYTLFMAISILIILFENITDTLSSIYFFANTIFLIYFVSEPIYKIRKERYEKSKQNIMSSIESKSTDFIKNNTERSIIKKLLRERCDKLYIEAIEKHSKKYKIKISCNPKESKLSFYQKHINQYALKLIDIATNNDFNLIIYDIEELKYTSDEIFNNIREIENNSIDLIYDIKPIYSTIHLLLKKIELDAKRNIDMIYSLMETLNKIEIGINKICYKLDEMKIASFLGDQIDNKKEELLKQFREEIQSKKELVKISINTAISTLSES